MMHILLVFFCFAIISFALLYYSVDLTQSVFEKNRKFGLYDIWLHIFAIIKAWILSIDLN